MVEQQQRQVEVSPAVQQELDKLNVRLADLLEQINRVLKVVVKEMVLRVKFAEMSSQQLMWWKRLKVALFLC